MQSMYDKIGKYDQDRINGFKDGFINDFIHSCNIKKGDVVLDAMAGDGNLSERILALHPETNLTTTDLSEAQCKIASEKLGNKSTVIRLDLTTQCPFENLFDIIIIKSGNHEIPLSKQQNLYDNIFKALKPNGRFINLGILLPQNDLRADLNTLNEYRSNLAGVPVDIKNRHFLTGTEFYSFLSNSGFTKITSQENFNYEIDMNILSEHYFKNDPQKKIIMNGIVTNLFKFREHKLAILKDDWVVKLPGEITVSHKPLNQ